MVETHALLQLLADGRFHSGEGLAEHFQVTRAAIWKRLRRLPHETGLHVQAVRGRGYRLAQAVELLDAVRLSQELAHHADNLIERLWVLPTVDSTNAFLTRQPPPAVGHGLLCLAEYQHAGRGRRGRRWSAGFGSGLMMSLAWRFDLPLSALSGLSLAVGVAVAEALERRGLEQHRLKWPNDVLVEGCKLGGILVEAHGEAQGPVTAVIGLGLNVKMTEDQAEMIEQPWIDLAAAGLSEVSRNALASDLCAALVEAAQAFAVEGLAPFLTRWARYDGLAGRVVRVTNGRHEIVGSYRGVDASGALIIETEGQSCAYHAGEVSVRGD